MLRTRKKAWTHTHTHNMRGSMCLNTHTHTHTHTQAVSCAWLLLLRYATQQPTDLLLISALTITPLVGMLQVTILPSGPMTQCAPILRDAPVQTSLLII
jgi:hypothetical protein